MKSSASEPGLIQHVKRSGRGQARRFGQRLNRLHHPLVHLFFFFRLHRLYRFLMISIVSESFRLFRWFEWPLDKEFDKRSSVH